MSFPDLAAQAYWEFVGEEQLVYQLLFLGDSEYSIENTPIAAFPEIQTEIIGPHGHVTLFPTDVTTEVELSGQELMGRQTGTWSRSGRTVTVTPTAHSYGSGQAKYRNFTTGSGISDVYLITALTANTSSLPRRPTRPIVAGLFARRFPGVALRCVFGWRPAAGADTYNVEMAEGIDVDDPAARWTPVGDTSAATQAQCLLHSARTMIRVRVRGVGLTAGPWIAATLGSLIPTFWNTDATPFWTNDSNPFRST